MTTPTILVHGGAGAMRGMTPEREARYRDGLRAAAAAGRVVLQSGGSALDACVAAMVDMEDGGVFNAGLGSCLTTDGTVEMDAAVMRGSDRAMGAVAGVPHLANPTLAARLVMDETPHCLLAADGALAFAEANGLPRRPDFPPAHRKAEWARKRAKLEARTKGKSLEEGLAELGGVLGEQEDDPQVPGDNHDTVGAVAIDSEGRLAAAVTTGGIWLKMPGRVGDSPLPGAGFWAVDGQGAAVATGTGESLMRVMICHEAVHFMRGGDDAQAACEAAVDLLASEFGVNQGGLIALDPAGRVGWAINTNGMGRGVWREGMSTPAIAVWPDEPWDRPV